jgi:hypothetical protein
MSADAFTSRLKGVKRIGENRWQARCPAHGDRSPSLSVRELPDGRVLVHCFAGCGVADVVAAVGLDLQDLFPPSTPGPAGLPRERRPFTVGEAVRALSRELQVAWVILADVANGRPIAPEGRARAAVARDRCLALIEELRDAG